MMETPGGINGLARLNATDLRLALRCQDDFRNAGVSPALFFAGAPPASFFPANGPPPNQQGRRDACVTGVASCAGARPNLAAFRIVLLLLLAITSGNTRGAEYGALTKENPSSFPGNFCDTQTTLYFEADDGIHGRELWSCDTQGDYQLVVDLVPGAKGAFPDHPVSPMLKVGNCLYFVADTPETGLQAWRYDPATGTTRVVTGQIDPLHDAYPPMLITNPACHLLYIVLGYPGNRATICVSDADAEDGKVRLIWRTPDDNGKYTFGGTVPMQNGSLFFSYGKKLWMHKPDSPSPDIVREMDLGAIFPFEQRLMADVSGERGTELWVSDGTAEGTSPIKDVYLSSSRGSSTGGLLELNGVLYLVVDSDVLGRELWRTDGTSGGTYLVKDINPGVPSSNPYNSCVVGDKLFFLAEHAEYGKELWVTDGTEAGTRLVRDLVPGPVNSDPYGLTAFQDRLFFCAKVPETGEEMFVSDGTPEGTTLFADIIPGSGSSGPANLTVFNGQLYFSCNDGIHGDELWVTDGTREGTRLAADINVPRYNPSSSPRELTTLGNNAFFVVRTLETGEEIWTSDGTETGTCVLKNIAPGAADSGPAQLTRAATQIFFSADDGICGRELWATGGTAETTHCVMDVNSGPDGSKPEICGAFGDRVCFMANSHAGQRGLWMSDGTVDGTVQINASSELEPDQLKRVFMYKNRLFLYAGNERALTLWEFDDKGRHVQPVAPLCHIPLKMLSDEHLSSIGPVPALPEGTELTPDEFLLLPILYPPTRHANRQSLPVAHAGMTYFAHETDTSGAELWKTDGTLQGTVLVADLFPGPASSSPRLFYPCGDKLYFIAEHAVDGSVIWETDGTRPGTREFRFHSWATQPVHTAEIALLGHVLAAAGGAAFMYEKPASQITILSLEGGDTKTVKIGDATPQWPEQLTPAESQVFFTANDGVNGRELWVTDGTENGTHLVKDILSSGDIRALDK
jgi:ELWxxDGT repeat protein